jgi:large subunit ribosomal protein L4
MAEVKRYTTAGKEAGTVSVNDAIFGVTINPALIHDAIVIQEANSRVILSNTKDRSEVAGTGKKPWKQKGTGRARHGSRRSPIWIGGGITFGPTLNRVFGKKINRKARRKAMFMLLTDKVLENRLIVVDSFDSIEAKTKAVKAMRNVLPGATATALIATSKDEQNVVLGSGNIQKTQAIAVTSLNVRDLSKFTYLIISEKGLEQLVETYSF